MKLSELCESERPREKMLGSGAAALSNAELMAILLRSGSSEQSVLELAHELLNLNDGKLTELVNMGAERLCAIRGIGAGKACTILAAFELGRRFLQEQCDVDRKAITSARTVYELMLPSLKALKHEEFWLLLLNEANYLIRKIKATTGGDSSTVIDVRQVLRLAINNNASGIILIHNHPSCNPRPSEADIRQTKLMRNAAHNCGLRLLDHVIVCDDCFYSFEEDAVRRGITTC